MNKSELISTVAEHTKLPPKTVADVLNALTEVIPTVVAAGEQVAIAGFGAWEAVERAERTGHNPQTKEPLTIPATRAPKFKPGSVFKGLVADSKSPVPA